MRTSGVAVPRFSILGVALAVRSGEIWSSKNDPKIQPDGAMAGLELTAHLMRQLPCSEDGVQWSDASQH